MNGRAPKKQRTLTQERSPSYENFLYCGQDIDPSVPARSLKTSTAITASARVPRKASKKPSRSQQTLKTRDSKDQLLSTFFTSKSDAAQVSVDSPSLVSKVEGAEISSLLEEADDRSEESCLPTYEQTQTSCPAKPTAITSKPRHTISESHQTTSRFKIPLSQPVTASSIAGVSDPHSVNTSPWYESHGPNNVEELAVNKQKVSEVRHCLETIAMSNEPGKLLVVKGPAGSGKSVTLKLVAKAMGFSLQEWANPIENRHVTSSHVDVASRFEELLNSTGRFGKLQLGTPGKQMVTADITQPHLVLVEEYPALSTPISHSLHSFRTSILRYLAAPGPVTPFGETFNGKRLQQRRALAIVVSDCQHHGISSQDANLTAESLLGPAILEHPSVRIIDFKPVAPTYLKKALDLVIRKRLRCSGARTFVDSELLKRLSESGDLRNAIGSLEYTVSHRRTKSNFNNAAASNIRDDCTSFIACSPDVLFDDIVSSRTVPLGLFHSVAKVVYNKRDSIGPSAMHRPYSGDQHKEQGVPDFKLELLFNEAGTDPETFVAALHENFVPSCQGQDFLKSLDHCLESISDADILLEPRTLSSGPSGGQGSWASRASPVGLQRAGEISFNIAVRGLRVGLPLNPRRAMRSIPHFGKPGKRKEPFKMYFPVSVGIRQSIQTMRQEYNVLLANSIQDHYGPEPGEANALAMTAQIDRITQLLPYLVYMNKHKLIRDPNPSNHVIQTLRQRHETGDLHAEVSKHEVGGMRLNTPSVVPKRAISSDLEKSYSTSGTDYQQSRSEPGAQKESFFKALVLSDDDIVDTQ